MHLSISLQSNIIMHREMPYPILKRFTWKMKKKIYLKKFIQLQIDMIVILKALCMLIRLNIKSINVHVYVFSRGKNYARKD